MFNKVSTLEVQNSSPTLNSGLYSDGTVQYGGHCRIVRVPGGACMKERWYKVHTRGDRTERQKRAHGLDTAAFGGTNLTNICPNVHSTEDAVVLTGTRTPVTPLPRACKFQVQTRESSLEEITWTEQTAVRKRICNVIVKEFIFLHRWHVAESV